MTLAPLDIFFIVIIVVAGLRCTVRGFVAEVMSMAAVVAGLTIAVVFSGQVAQLLAKQMGSSGWNKVIGFLGLFVITYLIVKILEGLIQRGVERINLGGLDRALGFFLGIAEGLLLTAAIVFVLKVQPFFKLDDALHASRIATLMMQIFPVIPIPGGSAGQSV